jgi:dihydroorotate dehydrogenase electron transfer subunit
MLKAVQQIAAQYKVETLLSLESVMPCGVGTCLGCVVPKAGEQKYLRVCREGPVFNAREVVL